MNQPSACVTVPSTNDPDCAKDLILHARHDLALNEITVRISGESVTVTVDVHQLLRAVKACMEILA